MTTAAAFTYIGTTTDGTLHVFASLMSWDVKVCCVLSGVWTASDDPEFPRFVIDSENDLLHDLDTNTTYELAPVGI